MFCHHGVASCTVARLHGKVTITLPVYIEDSIHRDWTYPEGGRLVQLFIILCLPIYPQQTTEKLSSN